VKRGEKVNPNEVDTITGATISSEAVISILNGGSERWVPLVEKLEGGEVSP
jgi:electron transport complex protein RnfG